MRQHLLLPVRQGCVDAAVALADATPASPADASDAAEWSWLGLACAPAVTLLDIPPVPHTPPVPRAAVDHPLAGSYIPLVPAPPLRLHCYSCKMLSVQTASAMSAPGPPPPSDSLRFEYLPGFSDVEKGQRQPALRQHSPSSDLSPSDFRAYNRIAELMELYHNNFRHTFRTFYHAASSTSPSSSGPTVKQVVALGLTFLHNLREHEATEDRRLFPLLSTRMPAFYDASYATTAATIPPSSVPSPFAPAGHVPKTFGPGPPSGAPLHRAPPPASTSWPPSLGHQHRHLNEHALRIEKYLTECREGRRELLRDELTRELNSFGGVLFSHLDEEVRELGADRMRLYWTVEEYKRRPTETESVGLLRACERAPSAVQEFFFCLTAPRCSVTCAIRVWNKSSDGGGVDHHAYSDGIRRALAGPQHAGSNFVLFLSDTSSVLSVGADGSGIYILVPKNGSSPFHLLEPLVPIALRALGSAVLARRTSASRSCSRRGRRRYILVATAIPDPRAQQVLRDACPPRLGQQRATALRPRRALVLQCRLLGRAAQRSDPQRRRVGVEPGCAVCVDAQAAQDGIEQRARVVCIDDGPEGICVEGMRSGEVDVRERGGGEDGAPEVVQRRRGRAEGLAVCFEGREQGPRGGELGIRERDVGEDGGPGAGVMRRGGIDVGWGGVQGEAGGEVLQGRLWTKGISGRGCGEVFELEGGGALCCYGETVAVAVGVGWELEQAHGLLITRIRDGNGGHGDECCCCCCRRKTSKEMCSSEHRLAEGGSGRTQREEGQAHWRQEDASCTRVWVSRPPPVTPGSSPRGAEQQHCPPWWGRDQQRLVLQKAPDRSASSGALGFRMHNGDREARVHPEGPACLPLFPQFRLVVGVCSGSRSLGLPDPVRSVCPDHGVIALVVLPALPGDCPRTRVKDRDVRVVISCRTRRPARRALHRKLWSSILPLAELGSQATASTSSLSNGVCSLAHSQPSLHVTLLLPRRSSTMPPPPELADKRCHTCRRRRVVCDRLVPQCLKCTKAGVECLGYGKLVLWNTGVASRGKMMGKTFSQAPQAASASASASAEAADSSKAVVSVRAPPVDPLFQDLNDKSRFYLHHFAVHVCRDFVQRDIPGRNSARSLVQLSRQHPALLHVAIASSAHHLYNLVSVSDTVWMQEVVPWPPCALDRPSSDVTSRRTKYLEDALSAEEKGYRLLITALQAPDPDVNAILAAILLFVTSELIQSGKDRWRAHIDAAIRILKQLDTPGLALRGQPSSDSLSLREWLASELVVYIVLASTLSTSNNATVLPDNHSWLQAVLLRAEENNYLSCPATLLRVLLASSNIAHRFPPPTPLPESTIDTALPSSIPHSPPPPQTPLAEAVALLQIVNAFDPAAWAVEVEKRTSFADFESRMHIASAHKIAVRLYISRACPTIAMSVAVLHDATRQTRASLASAIIKHLGHIKPTDPLFKATPWPTFVAGAESEHEEEWDWVLKRLETAWTNVPWGYVRSEMELLKTIWEDKRTWMYSSAAESGLGFDWVQKTDLRLGPPDRIPLPPRIILQVALRIRQPIARPRRLPGIHVPANPTTAAIAHHAQRMRHHAHRPPPIARTPLRLRQIRLRPALHHLDRIRARPAPAIRHVEAPIHAHQHIQQHDTRLDAEPSRVERRFVQIPWRRRRCRGLHPQRRGRQKRNGGTERGAHRQQRRRGKQQRNLRAEAPGAELVDVDAAGDKSDEQSDDERHCGDGGEADEGGALEGSVAGVDARGGGVGLMEGGGDGGEEGEEGEEERGGDEQRSGRGVPAEEGVAGAEEALGEKKVDDVEDDGAGGDEDLRGEGEGGVCGFRGWRWRRGRGHTKRGDGEHEFVIVLAVHNEESNVGESDGEKEQEEDHGNRDIWDFGRLVLLTIDWRDRHHNKGSRKSKGYIMNFQILVYRALVAASGGGGGPRACIGWRGKDRRQDQLTGQLGCCKLRPPIRQPEATTRIPDMHHVGMSSCIVKMSSEMCNPTPWPSGEVGEIGACKLYDLSRNHVELAEPCVPGQLELFCQTQSSRGCAHECRRCPHPSAQASEEESGLRQHHVRASPPLAAAGLETGAAGQSQLLESPPPLAHVTPCLMSAQVTAPRGVHVDMSLRAPPQDYKRQRSREEIELAESLLDHRQGSRDATRHFSQDQQSSTHQQHPPSHQDQTQQQQQQQQPQDQHHRQQPQPQTHEERHTAQPSDPPRPQPQQQQQQQQHQTSEFAQATYPLHPHPSLRQSDDQSPNRDSPAPLVSPNGQRCSNCGTTKTPLWRRSQLGQTICNACGLYEKARNTARPPNLKRPPSYAPAYPASQGDASHGPATYVSAESQPCQGTCPGGGKCNGTGGHAACDGCPAFNNRVSKTAQMALNQAQRSSPSRGNLQSEHSAQDTHQPDNAENVVIACQNCHTTTTPLWRRDMDGHTICNACGLYYKLHGQHRPVEMKKSFIKRRKRVAPALGGQDTQHLSAASASPVSTSPEAPSSFPSHTQQRDPWTPTWTPRNHTRNPMEPQHNIDPTLDRSRHPPPVDFTQYNPSPHHSTPHRLSDPPSQYPPHPDSSARQERTYAFASPIPASPKRRRSNDPPAPPSTYSSSHEQAHDAVPLPPRPTQAATPAPHIENAVSATTNPATAEESEDRLSKRLKREQLKEKMRRMQQEIDEMGGSEGEN
ncbi:hypothetical protein FH972_026596 [Carpinus fangiana]|uniref:Zn(2)-C6 fungal-type domain-containing protein n=1 Tax=Carpinus fangiana TaxID=176857 RepID=A0A5N6L4R7_9ROSI|nr:hypothetical protein FH972_026596 [Carpinus fangiana]